eukprot:1153268-Pelagomonas_calceolata.AAC.5
MVFEPPPNTYLLTGLSVALCRCKAGLPPLLELCLKCFPGKRKETEAIGLLGTTIWCAGELLRAHYQSNRQQPTRVAPEEPPENSVDGHVSPACFSSENDALGKH